MQKTIQISLSPNFALAFCIATVSAVAVLANVSLLGLTPAFWGVTLFASALSLAFKPVHRKWSRITWAVCLLAGVIGYTLARNNGWLELEDVQISFVVYAGLATVLAWMAVHFEEAC
ncbi:hypothetical protein OIU34_24115 [Pararhizobium sp. BT-229]|uniref:hypothetical protein n=1 Tax=Pararhizobium sp. BT-229 TaxID=2986923 RepID=UPI0021F73F5D|nr:hypothetical protein [Pararhizobium sp. BT-229]MCV9964985.1 hypothetical protein [Pararhizobium sp. BT-229]